MDSYGNLCGTKNNWDGTNGPDLTFKKKLYYLNPLELLNPNTVQTAKAICVDACPSTADVCGVGSFPCRTSNQYRCFCVLYVLNPEIAHEPYASLVLQY